MLVKNIKKQLKFMLNYISSTHFKFFVLIFQVSAWGKNYRFI